MVESVGRKWNFNIVNALLPLAADEPVYQSDEEPGANMKAYLRNMKSSNYQIMNSSSNL